MYRPLQIANYVVYIAQRERMTITNLHLQKILYFLQANELISVGNALFRGNIEKWRLGPVVPDVYHEYKEYGSQPIEEIATEVLFNEDNWNIEIISFDPNDIDIETRERIEPLIINMLGKSPFELVDETHSHEPWFRFKSDIEMGNSSLCYTNEEISEYFLDYPEKLYEVTEG